MTIKEIFKSLNEYQYQAVIDESDATLLNACVGSGKTTVLISKIGYLYLTKNYTNSDVMCLTFTNKAALEIKERIKNNKYLKDVELEYCSTFHSVALKLLQESNELESLGYKKDFTIITPEEEEVLANVIINENNLKIKYLNKLSKRLENLKSNITTYGIMKEEDDIKHLKEYLEIEKKKQNLMSFDDLIENATKLNAKDKLNLKYIIIDEFQDSNKSQLEFISSIKLPSTKIFAVGDRNQTIYSFRGSNLNIFDYYKEKYQAKELTLPINYRSNASILELARRVLETNKITGIKEGTNKIILNRQYDEFNEADYLKDEIIKHINNNFNYKDIAILYRTRQQSKVIEDVFTKYNIPYTVVKRNEKEEDTLKEFFINYLKVLININDLIALKYIYQNEKYGKNSSDIYIRNMQQKNIDSLYEKIKVYSEKVKEEDSKNILNEYINLIDFTEDDQNEVADYLDKVNNEQGKTIYDKIINYINDLKLYVEEKKDIEDKVNLMTLHASKGLEFKIVYIIGANDGLIPISTKKEELEEEKRLFFVGITRAKDLLEISYYENPSIKGVKNEMSQFLKFIPPNLIEHKGLKNSQNNLKELRKMLVENNKIQSKKRLVEHSKYGIGEILEENEVTIKIKFENYGEKEFVKSFESLTYR